MTHPTLCSPIACLMLFSQRGHAHHPYVTHLGHPLHVLITPPFTNQHPTLCFSQCLAHPTVGKPHLVHQCSHVHGTPNSGSPITPPCQPHTIVNQNMACLTTGHLFTWLFLHSALPLTIHLTLCSVHPVVYPCQPAFSHNSPTISSHHPPV